MGANEFAKLPHIGESVLRVEDYRFITGAGNFAEDTVLPKQKYARFVRSSHAHANVKGIDTSAASQMPGVVGIITGKDIEGKAAGLPCGWLVHNGDGTPMAEPMYPFLALGKVLYVGQPLAMVVAETAGQAQNAVEAVTVDYEPLGAVIDMKTAKDGPLLHEDAPQNRCFHWVFGDKAEVDATFSQAAHITRLDLVNNRVLASALETRVVNAGYDQGTGEYTLYVTNQNPHLERMLISGVLQIPEHKLRVIAPDMGGGFGSKINLYPEELAALWGAKAFGCSIKWVADRSEGFLTDTHARDHISHAEMAMDKDGKFLALRVHTDANLGAYLGTLGSCLPTILYGPLMAGHYTTPQVYVEVDGWFTNTSPVDSYRGVGRAEASYLLERLVTRCGWDMGLSQEEIRRRNLITELPYQTPVALLYDSGDFDNVLTSAVKLADVAGFEERKQASKAKGLLRGIGFSSHIENSGLAPSAISGALGGRAGLYESGEIRVNPTGSVTVFTGSHSHGQGHETAYAQLVAARLGVAIDQVEIVHGDTGRILFGMGTYGSRSLAVGGTAIMKALDKIEEKAKKIAAHLLESSDADIEFVNGELMVKGTDKKVTFGEVAFAAYVPHNYPLDKLEPGLNESAFYDPPNFTYPNGAHICEVEVDPETGAVRVDRYSAADDFGTIVNPMIVEGQVHGGVAQGIGQALMEHCVYDPATGQLLTGSYMDYALPRANDLPNMQSENVVTPCAHNPTGSKGCGEAGAVGSPAAVINAVLDALRPLGVKDIDMPATPSRVWTAIQQASV